MHREYEVEVERVFRARQGLSSPVRAAAGLPSVSEIEVVLRAGVGFGEGQLTERGWFVDTDALAARLDEWVRLLSGQPWPALFAFRPTFELVAREIFGRLAPHVPQLAYVELADRTFGSRTRYRPGI
ncbi:hypothetical protein [Actinoplanes sp. RD1]|uniref:hypothetical protein n=1 Tax=Actinoplanes sp. RD1 TaxID=3064538 RepID=UPI0027415426|nr:hypothetical protein [Actinoplanes sp. RD1]